MSVMNSLYCGPGTYSSLLPWNPPSHQHYDLKIILQCECEYRPLTVMHSGTDALEVARWFAFHKQLPGASSRAPAVIGC